ncbi:MAG: M23 family metallopeptidase [Pseudoruegeria sp.]
MQDGVSVLAASDGVVIGLRNSMLDIRSNAPQAPALGGQECGNGVVLDHGDGWETQYCHLKKGSVTQSLGQSVQAGEVLGEVGLSGQTEFPHLHLSIRKDGQVVDPFTPKHATCGSYSSADALWQQPIDYVPAGLISIGFADAIPDFSNISKGTAHIKVLPTQTPALVLFASVFGASDDLSLGFRIEGPNGIFHEAKASFETDQAQAFRASGRNVNSTLAPGIYQGTVTLLRGNQIIGHRRVDVTITK